MGNRWIIGAVVVVALVLPAVAGAFAPELEHVYLEEAFSGWGFGASVDADAETDLVIVGSHRLEAAFVLERDAEGWVGAVLQSEDPTSYHAFGSAVAIEGDLAVVGANGYRGPLKQSAGALFLFQHVGERWLPAGVLQATEHEDPNNHHLENLGLSVALDDGVIVAGAPGTTSAEDSRATWQDGEAYVFESVDGEWVSQYLPNPDSERNDWFGLAVDIDGDLIAIGAPQDDESASDAGAVYLYRRDEGGEWVLDEKIVPLDPVSNLEFGFSVSIHEQLVVVGARGGSPRSGPAGRVHLVESTDEGWEQSILAQDVDGHSNFGNAVYTDGRHVYVSAFGYRDRTEHAGTVFVYETSPGGWVLSETIPGDPDDNGFGAAIGGDGDVLVFGSEAHSPRGDFSGEVAISGIPLFTCGGREPTLWGTRDDDEIVATIDPDIIFTGSGHDTISEVGPDDIVCTGFGTDTIVADQMPYVVDLSPQDHVIVNGFRQGAIDLG